MLRRGFGKSQSVFIGIDIAALTCCLLDTFFRVHSGDFALITLILQLIQVNLLLDLIVVGAALRDLRERARRLQTEPAAQN